MSGKRDSNSRPRPWQGRALPTELLPHFIGGVSVMNRDANLSLITKFPNRCEPYREILVIPKS
jgi:hypothetical protein